VNCIHVDTNVLLDPRNLRNLLRKCRNRQFKIKISPFALTEFIIKYAEYINRKRKELLSYPIISHPDPLNELLNGMMEGLVDVFIIKNEELSDFLKYINELQSEILWLSPSDVLIMASALADKECNGFMTLDKKILRSIRDPKSKIKEVFIRAGKYFYNEELEHISFN